METNQIITSKKMEMLEQWPKNWLLGFLLVNNNVEDALPQNELQRQKTGAIEPILSDIVEKEEKGDWVI